MPYITQETRKGFEGPIRTMKITSAGELNYCLTQLVNEYLTAHGLRYSTINDIVGALEGAKLEFYRRVASPYEDIKSKENGDVYP